MQASAIGKEKILDKDFIHKVIANPELLKQMEPKQLSEISMRYPYFSAVQLLLAKSLQQSGDYRFADQLHQAAVYAGDRKILYHWVKGKQSEEQNENESARNEVIHISEYVSAKSEVVFEEEIEKEEQVMENESAAELAAMIVDEDFSPVKEEEKTQEVTPVILDVSESSKVEITEKNTTQKMGVQETAIENSGSLEHNILIAAIHSSIESDVIEAMPAKLESEDEAANQLETPSEVDSYASYMLKRSRQLHFGEGSSFKEHEQASSVEMSDWMRVAPEQVQYPEAEEIKEEKAPDPSGASHGTERILLTDAQAHQKELIDRFISFEPQIARGRAADYTSGNVAKESLEEDFSMITETMAQLYARQGKSDKARKAYKKLMELYPEKSVYFAAQLKNLDKYKK